KAIASPLLDDTSIDGAKGILINFTGGHDLSIHEVEEAARIVQEAAHDEANIIFGAVLDPSLEDEVRMTVIATGFAEKRLQLAPHGEPPRYFTFPALTAAGLPHASTTRHCPGVTSPSEPTSPFTPGARETLAAAGLDLSRVAYARQVHGADVAHALTRGGVAGAVDVLSTTARGMPLAIFSADCLAVTLWDAEAGALALAHVGWRGTAKGAAKAAVRAATGLGARPARLRAAIAPSIGPCCYVVGEPVIGDFTQAFGHARWERWTRAASNGRVML